MAHDFDTQAWSDNHERVSHGLSAIFDKLAYAFKRLQAIEYDAPWERDAKRIRDALPKRRTPAEPTVVRAATYR